jgi:arylamine N-acetyltransferase
LNPQSAQPNSSDASVSLSAALRLELDTGQPTPQEPRRLIQEGALYFHQVRFGNEWHDVSEFTLEEMPPVDREVANSYTSTLPQSKSGVAAGARRAFPPAPCSRCPAHFAWRFVAYVRELS